MTKYQPYFHFCVAHGQEMINNYPKVIGPAEKHLHGLYNLYAIVRQLLNFMTLVSSISRPVIKIIK